ncbi:MAG: alpha-L-arabinofuranosidase, partial [Ilumatobacteraceae bacterium]
RVGAVGVGDPSSWSDWGTEVIEATGDQLDFYVVHQYGFDESPTADEALRRPAELWPDVLGQVNAAVGDDVPVAVTEYNLVSIEAGDTDRSMTQALNALYLADTIGQLALSGVAVANQWNLANGTTSSGTDYGMVDIEDGSTFPQYEAMRLWSTAGTELLGTDVGRDDVRVYATRHDDGRVTLLLVNLAEAPFDAVVEMVGDPAATTAEVSGVHAEDLTASELLPVPDAQLDVVDGSLTVGLPGWSIVVIEVGP